MDTFTLFFLRYHQGFDISIIINAADDIILLFQTFTLIIGCCNAIYGTIIFTGINNRCTTFIY